MIRIATIAPLLLLAGCAAMPTTAPSAKPIRIDHLIVGTNDLDGAMAELQRLTGVRPFPGGAHPGRGTRNALMSLGNGTYLEILAPDPAQEIENDDIRELRGMSRLTPIGWAVSADGELALRSVLSAANIATSASEPGSRAKPDGSILRWITFGYPGLDSALAPFFIVWGDPALHPSRTAPGGCLLERLSIDGPDGEAIADAIKPLGLSVPVTTAAQGRMRVSLSCPKGRVQL